jgi:hypothetical protein
MTPPPSLGAMRSLPNLARLALLGTALSCAPPGEDGPADEVPETPEGNSPGAFASRTLAVEELVAGVAGLVYRARRHSVVPTLQ